LNWETPLFEAILLKRYKRFLADVKLGEEFLTVHVPNTGAMKTCWEPNWKCLISRSENPTRKMPYTLEFTWNGETWIGIHSAFANKVVKNALQNQEIPELSGYEHLQLEKKIGESRVDFFLDGHPTHPATYVEVKSVTLKLQGLAQFPDGISERASKHLRELMELKKSGHRAVIFFLVQREDVEAFRAADSMDPTYAKLLREAFHSGVEILVYQCRINLEGIRIHRKLPYLAE
jgi:sugar fermentation stimulation protein A